MSRLWNRFEEAGPLKDPFGKEIVFEEPSSGLSLLSRLETREQFPLFSRGRFLYGVENGRLSLDRACYGRVWGS